MLYRLNYMHLDITLLRCVKSPSKLSLTCGFRAVNYCEEV